MAKTKLVILIEETIEETDRGMIVAYSIFDKVDDMQIGSSIPGIRPIILQSVKAALDFCHGAPASESDVSLEDARAKMEEAPFSNIPEFDSVPK